MGIQTTALGEGTDFSYNADLRLRYTFDKEQDGDDSNYYKSGNKLNQRFRWKSVFRVSEKFKFHFSLIHAASWGHSDFLVDKDGSNNTGDPSISSMTGTKNGENLLLVNEAYAAWMFNDELMIRAGRGGLNIGDKRVLGTSDWGSTQNAFEGLMFTYDEEIARFNLFGVKMADWMNQFQNSNSGVDVSDPELNMFGFTVDWKTLPEFFKMANLHVLQVSQDSNGDVTNWYKDVKEESNLRYGVVLTGDTHNVDYRLTYAAHTGSKKETDGDKDLSGNMIDVEVGYSMPDMMNSRFSVLYHMDSGDSSGTDKKEEMYDSFYYSKHYRAGLMDIYTYGNLTFIQLAWGMDLTDDMKLKAQYLMFSQTEKTGDIKTGVNGSGFATKSDTEDELGTEIDVEVTKKYEDNFFTTARLGMFSPGDEYKGSAEDSYYQFMLEAKMTF